MLILPKDPRQSKCTKRSKLSYGYLRLSKGTLRSKVGKGYIKVQGWQWVPKGPRLAKGTKGPILAQGHKGPRLSKVYKGT